PVRPLLGVLAEASAAVHAATTDLSDLVPEPGGDALAGRGGQDAADRAEAADQAAAALQHFADSERALPGLEAEAQALAEAAEEAEGRVTLLERAKHELPGLVAALDAQLCQARVSGAGLEAARERLDVVDKQRAAAEALAVQAPLLAGRAEAARAA